ncbi:hypothetical protein CWM88_28420, partial [Klebsiella pneumoniae]
VDHLNLYRKPNFISPLEAKILNLYLSNVSRKNIALNMGCSSKTIHNHILNSLRKIKIKRSRDLFI